MPIAFSCSGCAQVLRVADTMAGGKGKCPKCGAILRVPSASEAIPKAPPQAARPKPRPAAADIIEEKALPRRRAETARDDDGTDAPEEATARPRKASKNKKRKMAPALLYSLVGGGCFGLLLLCSGFSALAWWYFSGSVGDDLKYMPSNCQFIFSIRNAQLTQSEAFQELRREIPDVDRNMKGELGKEVGFSNDDIEKMVVGVGATPKDVVILIQAKNAVEVNEIRAKIPNSNYTEAKIGKYVVQESQTPAHPTFCVLDKKRVLFGEKDAVRAVLLRDKKPEFAANMQAALKQVDFSKTMAFAIDTQAVSDRSDLQGGLNLLGGQNEMLSSLKKTKAVTVQIQVAADIRFDFALLCQDAATAGDVKKLLDGFLVMGRNAKLVPKEVSDLMELNLKADGNTVTGNNTFKVGPLIKLYKQQMQKEPMIGRPNPPMQPNQPNQPPRPNPPNRPNRPNRPIRGR